MSNVRMTLREELTEWTEPDVAAERLGRCIGLWDVERLQTSLKHVFWSDNPLGTALFRMLDAMVDARVLERDDADRVRWSTAYRGSWQDK